MKGLVYLPLKANFFIILIPELESKTLQRNQSVMGFQNSWATVQINRGVENWGSGHNIQLALNENSDPYNYFLLASNYGKIRVRYIHGFLERIEGNVNRYVSARGLEWTNNESFILGFSETIIYSGENRPIELGYLNPISSHLEVELNNRLNLIGNSGANAVWQLHLDYLYKKRFRVSLNLLYDEFVIDPKIEIGKENGRAFSSRLSYTPIFIDDKLLTLYSSYIYVGTPTFRHGNGANNFINNGKPLGWPKGSDSQDISLGISYMKKNKFITSTSIGYIQVGDESINNRSYDPYLDYQKGSFPSGKIVSQYYLHAEISNDIFNYYLMSGHLYFSQNYSVVSVSLSLPVNIKI